MHYYSFNIGDYKKKTDHLNNEEDLAYRRLIDFYYDQEKALPNDHVFLARKIRMRESAEIVKNILQEFFKLEEDGLWHKKRCDKEISGYLAMQIGGKMGAEKRWNSVPNKGGNAPPIMTPMPTNNHKPITINQDSPLTPQGGRGNKKGNNRGKISWTEAGDQLAEKYRAQAKLERGE